MTRLPHGYTNATSVRAGVVYKTYTGADASERATGERIALTGLRGLFPVPEIVDARRTELQLVEVHGAHGQEALDAGETVARNVLRLCGSLRRRLDEIDTAAVAGLPGRGASIVHGDFGPNNMLVTDEGTGVAAVLDWEWARLGDPVEDLAWAEWIVRTHHPHVTHLLDELFAGYGRRPPWRDRHQAMLRAAERCLAYCERDDNPGGVELWRDRIERTRAFRSDQGDSQTEPTRRFL